jgi:hypothetical protein
VQRFNGQFASASGIKSILATGLFPRVPDATGLDQTMFLSGPIPPRPSSAGDSSSSGP